MRYLVNKSGSRRSPKPSRRSAGYRVVAIDRDGRTEQLCKTERSLAGARAAAPYAYTRYERRDVCILHRGRIVEYAGGHGMAPTVGDLGYW